MGGYCSVKIALTDLDDSVTASSYRQCAVTLSGNYVDQNETGYPDGKYQFADEFGLPDKKLQLAGVYTVTFASGHAEATHTMDAQTVPFGRAYTMPECGFVMPEGWFFVGWQIGDADPVIRLPGDTVVLTGDATATALWRFAIPFGTPDFTIPDGTAAIEANAFDGIAATVAVIPANCAVIGDHAFKDCRQLTMIRIPAG